MRFPFKTLFAMGMLSYVLVDNPPLKLSFAHTREMVKKAEFYPLSSFPMYSTFSETPFLVYVSDSVGRKVAIDTALKTHASELKKIYEVRLKEQKKKADLDGRLTDVPLELKNAAGRATLELLKARPPVQEYLATRPDKTLQLREVVLSLGEDGIDRREVVVAELQE